MSNVDTSKTTWDLSSLLSSDNDPTIEERKTRIEKDSYAFINKWKDREDYLKDPKILKEALDEYNEWTLNSANASELGYYFGYRLCLDQSNTDLKAKEGQIEDFSQKISNDISFFTIRLAKIDAEAQHILLSSPEVAEYKHFLEYLFAEAKYVLTESEEKIMNLKSKTSYANWVNMVDEFLSKEEREVLNETGEKVTMGFEAMLALTMSQKKEVRDSVLVAINDILSKHSALAEIELNSVLENKKVNDEIRGFVRPDAARHLSDDVDTEVVDALVNAVTTRNDISQRFYTLKAKLLGIQKLRYDEKNISYGTVDKKYDFQQSVDLVYKVFEGLDPQFASIFKDFVENGQVDVYPKKGKTGGAFCSFGSTKLPILILLNHSDKLRDVLTLAHESGHGINHYLMGHAQKPLNAGSSLFTAECASTFMEDFVLEEILKDADDDLKFSILVQKLNDFASTIFRQIACYNFETDLHREYREKGYLSKEEIGKIFSKNMSAYLGDSVEMNPGTENWWIYWGHIRSYFYVYSYASGLLISKSMQNSVKQDHAFIEKVKGFLSAGSSDSPKNTFAKLGIDVTKKEFWEKGLNEIGTLLNETEALAKKLGKI